MTLRNTLCIPLLALSGYAQTLAQLQHACVPSADPVLLRAIIQTESAGNPWALSLNHPRHVASGFGLDGKIFLKRQPRTKQEAIRWTSELLAQGKTVSVGLMQVNVEGSPVPLASLFDPCTNLRLGWAIFIEKYSAAVRLQGPGQSALHMAISAYNTGSFAEGFHNGYLATVLAHAGDAQ